MRTSLNDIAVIEKYLFNQLSSEESLLFEARMLTNPMLRWQVHIQNKIYLLIKYYHRAKIKEEAEMVHRKLFNDPLKKKFRDSIYQLFKQ